MSWKKFSRPGIAVVKCFQPGVDRERRYINAIFLYNKKESDKTKSSITKATELFNVVTSK